jgi:hypothetical protein
MTHPALELQLTDPASPPSSIFAATDILFVATTTIARPININTTTNTLFISRPLA